MSHARSVRVMGRVQGVGYRAWTRAEAERLGLRGWVMNRDDGSVIALLCGPREAVETMIERMRDGPGAAVVRDLREDSAAPNPEPDGFEIRV